MPHLIREIKLMVETTDHFSKGINPKSIVCGFCYMLEKYNLKDKMLIVSENNEVNIFEQKQAYVTIHVITVLSNITKLPSSDVYIYIYIYI